MNYSEREQKIFDTYPKLFRRVNLNMSETCMCWGLEGLPDEWMNEIETLCEQINEIAPDAFEFEQVKMKWGGIRVYYDVVGEISKDVDKKISDLVDGVEQRCYNKKYIY
jgi:hypothetical protein